MANNYNSQLDAFDLYHKTQESAPSLLNSPALPALGHALAGSTGTAISNLAIYPLDLIITRLQVQRQLRKSSSSPEEGEYRGVLDAFSKIYEKEGGVSSFYTGVVQDTGKSIADSFLFFLFYNYLRTSRLQQKGGKTTTLPVIDELAVGAFAGACSKFFTTPISNIVTRKQTSSLLSSRSSPPSASSPSVSSIGKSIYDTKGLSGFWSGYSASLILTLNPSLTFFLYEFFKRSFLPRSKRDDPGARITFLMAAVSKAIASSITYPFSLAKARTQVESSPPVDKPSAEKVKDDVAHASSTRDAEEATHNAKSLAKRTTVFSTILDIYKKEGIEALYEGIWGEILKGFFSHGITMIVKESIHKLIIQAYFLVLRALDRHPSPAELAKQAEGAVKERVEKMGEVVREGYAGAVEKVVEAVESGKDIAGVAKERIGVMGDNAQEAVRNAAERVGVVSGDAREAMNIAAERAGIVENNVSKAAKTANDYASKEAGHLLGNAQEQLGGKIEEVGKGIKTEK